MTSLIGVIHADNIFFNTIHAYWDLQFMKILLLENFNSETNSSCHAVMALLPLLPSRVVDFGPRLCWIVGVCHTISFLSPSITWWIDTNKRQAYVQAGLLAETRTVMSDFHQSHTGCLPCPSSDWCWWVFNRKPHAKPTWRHWWRRLQIM